MKYVKYSSPWYKTLHGRVINRNQCMCGCNRVTWLIDSIGFGEREIFHGDEYLEELTEEEYAIKLSEFIINESS